MKQNEADQIESMYIHYYYKCFCHGNPAKQRAHIIGQTVPNYKVYGKAIVDDPLNWLPACDTDCNALIDTGKNTLLKNSIERYIKSGNRAEIEQLVRDNIARKKERLCKIDDV